MHPSSPDRSTHLATAQLDLGIAQARRGQPARAAACYRRAAELAPGWALPVINLGTLALATGATSVAVDHFRSAVALDPGCAFAHRQLAYALLQSGAFEEGFRELEWRFDRGGATPRYPGSTAPVWDGRHHPGKTMMLFCEQGYGTRMQMIRFARRAARRVGRVLCTAEGPEARLLATCPGVERVVRAGDATPPYDLQAPLVSLPHILGARADTLATTVPYLSVPEDASIDPRALAGGDGLRIGFAWASGTAYGGACRDAPLAAFARLARTAGTRWYSFQFDARRAALASLDGPVVDLGPRLGDFARTAAYCTRMDLIVTVDTALAHLAGALGKPVWIVLPRQADWRWLDDRDDSPWYPTARLFRQQRIGDWSGVFTRVAAALRRFTTAAFSRQAGAAWPAGAGPTRSRAAVGLPAPRAEAL